MNKIYTRHGDNLTTQTIGGDRVAKHSPLVDFYGEVDSLNAVLGVVAAKSTCAGIVAKIEREQRNLFLLPQMVCPQGDAGRQLGADGSAVLARATAVLEEEIDRAAAMLPRQCDFLLPGGHESAAFAGLARTQCRRAERAMSLLAETCGVAAEGKSYLNRLSDWLFVMTRVLNKISNVEEKTLHNTCR